VGELPRERATEESVISLATGVQREAKESE
jgi:hypothetical protein